VSGREAKATSSPSSEADRFDGDVTFREENEKGILSAGRMERQFDQIVGNQYSTSHPA
jgi:hypothetical protein